MGYTQSVGSGGVELLSKHDNIITGLYILTVFHTNLTCISHVSSWRILSPQDKIIRWKGVKFGAK
jgi:hypothetical protein